MSLKLAFAGLRHGHIAVLYNLAKDFPGVKIVAACEEDDKSREEIRKAGTVDVTHSSIDKMLSEVDCDAVAVGDYYSKRGQIIIKSLEKGRHVISDKPMCTCLKELDKISSLAKSKNLKVGCMFDVRDMPQFIALRDIVRSGAIGEVHNIVFGGQHPLMLGVRPNWYFEDGKHGGTLNDIAVHAVDFIPWATGLSFDSVVAARCWNAYAKPHPKFNDCAQVMLKLSNGAGVLGDVSYALPDSHGYSNPFYWRTTFFGSKGIAETFSVADKTTLAVNGEKVVRKDELPAGNPGGFLKSFLNAVAGKKEDLDTESNLRTARVSLLIQKAADEGLFAQSLR